MGDGRSDDPGAVLELQEARVSVAGVCRLDSVSLRIEPGELVAVAGVSGNGQEELAELCAGLRRPERGRVLVGGRELRGGAATFHRAGVAYLSADRYREATDGRLTLVESAMLKSYRKMNRGPFRLLDWRRAEVETEALVRRFTVRCGHVRERASALSGGNLQKLLLGRELGGEPRLLVVNQPTQGLDLTATRFIRQQLREQARRGAAVLVISCDLDEVLALATRILVLYRGRIVGSFDCRSQPPERPALGRLMAGLEVP